MTLFWLKVIHTAITLINSAAVCYILYCGIKDRQDRLLAVAIALVVIESIALVSFGWICPLQLYARHITGSDGYVHDLFLPGWMAGNIVEFFTPIALLGLFLVARNHLRRRRSLQASQ